MNLVVGIVLCMFGVVFIIPLLMCLLYWWIRNLEKWFDL